MTSSASSTATLSVASPPPRTATNGHNNNQNNQQQSQPSDTISIASSFSQISQCPDRHGFYGGFQFSERPKEVLSRQQIMSREKKWLHMMENWDTYMNKNYKKVSQSILCKRFSPTILFFTPPIYASHSNCTLKVIITDTFIAFIHSTFVHMLHNNRIKT